MIFEDEDKQSGDLDLGAHASRKFSFPYSLPHPSVYEIQIDYVRVLCFRWSFTQVLSSDCTDVAHDMMAYSDVEADKRLLLAQIIPPRRRNLLPEKAVMLVWYCFKAACQEQFLGCQKL